MFSWVVVLGIAILMAAISNGFFAMFGFTPTDGFIRKLGFFVALVLQVFIPLALCNGAYLLTLRSEKAMIDEAKEHAENVRSIQEMIAKDEQK